MCNKWPFPLVTHWTWVGIVIGLLTPLTPVAASDKLSEAALYCQYQDPFKQYACMTEHAVQGINYTLGKALSKNDLDIYRAVEAMSLVQNVASSGRYNYLAQRHPTTLALPMDKQSRMLKRAYGLCGNHQAMFLEIMQLLQVKARPVDFYYVDDAGQPCSHAAVEVKIGKKWRYFDITWASIWVRERDNLSSLLSLEEVRRQQGIRLSGLNSWYLHFKYPHRLSDPLQYLTASSLQILKNKGGLLVVPVRNNEINLSQLPRYVGRISPTSTPLRMALASIPYPMDAIIDVQGVGGLCTRSFLSTSVGRYPVRQGKMLIRVRPGSTLAIQGKDDICYAVIKTLALISDHDTRLRQAPVEYATLQAMTYVNAYLYRQTAWLIKANMV